MFDSFLHSVFLFVCSEFYGLPLFLFTEIRNESTQGEQIAIGSESCDDTQRHGKRK